jgi:NADPH:quinone reductase-like Zn-dependent oxidoreductase
VRRLRPLGAASIVDSLTADYEFILDCVGGPVFGLAIEHLAPRGLLVNIATPDDVTTVSFRAGLFDRSAGARIYTLNNFDEVAAVGGAGKDLARLCALVARGRLDGQVEYEASWREPERALDALIQRRIGGKAVLHVDQR